LFVYSFVHSEGDWKEVKEWRGKNDEGKKSNDKRKKELKRISARSHTYRHFSISAVPKL
jgi:hypothetical protein